MSMSPVGRRARFSPPGLVIEQACAAFGDAPIDRGVGAVGDGGDLAVAVAGGGQEQVAPLRRCEPGEALQAFAVDLGGERVLERLVRGAGGVGERWRSGAWVSRRA